MMEGFVIPAHAVDFLERSFQDHVTRAEAAVSVARQTVLDEIRSAASTHPQWGPQLAEEIDTWDENDRLWYGVRGPEFASETLVAEFGLDKTPPSGLLRTLDSTMQLAAARGSGMLVNGRGGL